MDKQKAQFLVDNKDLLKRVCTQLIADVQPNEIFIVSDYIDVLIENLENIDLERVPSGEVGDVPLGFGNATDLLLSAVVPVITSTLSKLSEYFIADKLKDKAENKTKKPKEQSMSYQFQYYKSEMTVKLRSNKLTRKKADELSQKILELIAQEL